MSDTTPSTIPTQRQRRLKYGLNVAVLVLAVLVIVILANWIGYRRFTRFDFTHTRQYSLSPQTMGVIAGLETPIQITTFYDAGSVNPELRRRVDDLIEEYARRSAQISVQQIDPTTQLTQRNEFIQTLLSRYADAAKKNQDALKEAQDALSAGRSFAQQQTQRLASVMPKLQGADPQLIGLLQQLNQIFLVLDAQLQQGTENLEQVMAESLPNYQQARTVAADSLSALAGILKQALDRFNTAIDNPATPNEAKDALLGLRAEYQPMHARLEQTVTQLTTLDSGEYDEIRSRLTQSNSIVISGNDDVVVITLDDLFPNLLLAQFTQGQVLPEQGFKGEEVLTGALVKLTLKHNTKVVFVNPYTQSVLGAGPNQQGLSFRIVADRLAAMNFEVSEWQPAGGVTQFGPTPPQPRPVAEPEQTMVFVILPPPPANPQRATMPTAPMVAEALTSHLAAGQPAIIFTAPSPMERIMGQPDLVTAPLKGWGINVDGGHVIVSAVPAPQDATPTAQVTNQLRINDWPDDHAIARSVRGLTGMVYQGQPITLAGQPPEGVQLWPLIRTPEDTWAEADFNVAQAQRDEADPAGPFTVGVAASKGEHRLVVISDFAWATDMVASAGPQQPVLRGGQLDVITLYHYFPANPELFVNSVYWLAGLDQLIAPGARTQETRRIEPISPAAMQTVWWMLLLGLPLLTLAAGGVVWTLRRR